MGKSYLDSAKQRSREKLREFIATNLSYRRPGDIQVLCFPGAEQEGQEAIEVKEVYDPLGIPREKIVGLEYDRQRAERLRRANLGIRVVEQSDLAYFQSTDHQFSIISLDYTGVRQKAVQECLELIASRQLLEPGAVLALNTLAHREHRNVQKYLHGRAAINTVTDDHLGLERIFDSKNPHLGLEQFANERVRAYAAALTASRDVFTQEVIRVFFMGRAAHEQILGEHDPFYLLYPNSAQVRADLWKRYAEHGVTPAQAYSHELAVHSEMMQRWLDAQLFRSVTGIPNRERFVLFQLISAGFRKVRYADAVARYQYVSNSGSKMELDLFSMRTVPKFYKLEKHFSVAQGTSGQVLSFEPPTGSALRQFGVAIAEAVAALNGKAWRDLPERIDLGSSAPKRQRKVRKDPITRDEALALLASGCTTQELAECFDVTPGQARAWKAHITMGTYAKRGAAEHQA